jgi:hypothetical protein
MSIRIFPGGEGKAWPASKADNLWAYFLDNVGASTSLNPMEINGLLQGCLF